MKRLAIITVMVLSTIPTWGQIKGLDDYQRTKSQKEMVDNQGTRFYYKPNGMAYLGYSCYISSGSEDDVRSLLSEKKCAISEKNVMEVYDELIRILLENGLHPENFEELTGTNEMSYDNVFNAAILNSETIFAHYSIGMSNVYFTADNYSVELTIMDRKGTIFKYRQRK